MATNLEFSVAASSPAGVYISKVQADPSAAPGPSWFAPPGVLGSTLHKGHAFVRPGETIGLVLDSMTALVIEGPSGAVSVRNPADGTTVAPSTGLRSKFSSNGTQGGIEGANATAYAAQSLANATLQTASVAPKTGAAAAVANQLGTIGPQGVTDNTTFTSGAVTPIAVDATVNLAALAPGSRYMITGA